MTLTKTIVSGTRTSQLALWQTNYVKQKLEGAWPGLVCQIEPFVTQGDKTLDKPLPEIGGKGLFTAELEAALADGRIDIAVHSLKDLPVTDAPGLTVGAITSRADVRDVLVARDKWTLGTLPLGATVGTSSLRRKAQLLHARPDLNIQSIRGNVDTRLQKVQTGLYDATILAAAGLTRLGMESHIAQYLPLDVMLPAPGQGALAVQCRTEDTAVLSLLAPINDADTRCCVLAERAFLDGLGSGCSLPVGAYATIKNNEIMLTGLVAAVDGSRVIEVNGYGRDPHQLGAELAAQALAQGAVALLRLGD
ncbi:MAG TPA: hydroxymethylbilane synthase [Chloroflexota bacterium]|nr:hydroxymethylbilane synthase [Chloroflexota bacterium]